MTIKSVLFVCTGNTCRSPMAEALLNRMLEKEGVRGVRVESRGTAAATDDPMTSGAREALAEVGISAPEHGARKLEREDLAKADLVLVMERKHRSSLTKQFPDESSKIFVLKEYSGAAGSTDIADPLGGSPKDYQKCRIEIQDSLLALLTQLKSSEGSTAP